MVPGDRFPWRSRGLDFQLAGNPDPKRPSLQFTGATKDVGDLAKLVPRLLGPLIPLDQAPLRRCNLDRSPTFQPSDLLPQFINLDRPAWDPGRTRSRDPFLKDVKRAEDHGPLID